MVSDANGQYLGFDKKVHTVTGGQQAQYGTYSGWDIYRTQAQLSALLAPQQMSDSATSMLNDAAQDGGMLPKWATVGSTFTTVAQVRGNTADVTTNTVSTTGRYIRLNIITPTADGSGAARIYEFEAYS